MKPIKYYKPRSVSETLELLLQYGDKAAILAGGTELVVDMKSGKRNPQVLINIKNIEELKGISFPENKVVFGPLVTLAEIEDNRDLGKKIPVLCKVAAMIGSRQVRNIATIGGNVANAAPCADMVPPLIALDAIVTLYSQDGEEKIPVKNFFLGPGETIAGYEKLLGPIEIYVPSFITRISYQYLTLRRAMDVTIASVVTRVDVESSIVTNPRIVMGAVAPTPLRSNTAETLLDGSPIESLDLDTVAKAAADDCQPIDDVRASARYREEMIRVLTRKTLEKVLST